MRCHKIIASSILFLFLFSTLVGMVSFPQRSSNIIASPSTAIIATTKNTYPAAGQTLYANNNYNFTTGIRDDSLYNQTFDGGNLQVTNGGDEYANASLIPPGTYAGDYSFDNDKAGGLAEGFTYTIGAGGSFEVADSYLGHSKVLKETQSSSSSSFVFAKLDVVATSGSISLWMCTTNTSAFHYFTGLSDSSRTNYWQVAILAGYFQAYTTSTATWLNTGIAAAANRWYYSECIYTPTYVSWYVDGVLIANFTSASISVSNTYVGTYSTAGAPYYQYYDAITITPDVTGGTYNSEQDFDDFTDYGNYMGAYTFAADAAGSDPAGWSVTEYGGTLNVVDSASGHSKVVELDRTSNPGTGSLTMETTIATISTGYVEFWIYCTDLSGTNAYQMFGLLAWGNSYANGFYVVFGNYGSGGAGAYALTNATGTKISALNANQWYHVSIYTSTVSDFYRVYVDGVDKGQFCRYYTAGDDSVTTLRFSSAVSASYAFTGNCYIDALDYSTASGYTPQQNMRENITGLTYADASMQFVTTKINATVSGHANALWINKSVTYSSSQFKVSNSFSTAQVEGTVEFWFYPISVAVGGFYIYIRSTVSAMIVLQWSSNGNLYTIKPGWAATILGKLTYNAWNHVRVEFDCAASTHSVFLNGYKKIGDCPNYNTVASVNQVQIAIDPNTFADCCFDSFDYSWNASWNLNRNWRTLPIIDNNVDLSQIGIYNGTDSFESAQVFGVPAGWLDQSDTNSYCTAKVVPMPWNGAYGHHNVLALEDISASYLPRAYRSFTPFSSGTVEFWVMTNDTRQNTQVYLYDSGITNYAMKILIASNNLYSYSSSSTFLLQPAYNNTWYHVRVALDCATDKYSVWVNGYLRQSNLPFQAGLDNIGEIRFAGDLIPTGYMMYFDAFDVSSDMQYYSERSTYMQLQQNATLPQAGSYSYRFQAWSAGTSYSQAWTPFQVEDNVQLVSSSSQATQWQLTDLATSPVWSTEYASNFATETYTEIQSSGTSRWIPSYGTALYTASFTDAWTSSHPENISLTGNLVQDTYVDSGSPDTSFSTASTVKMEGGPSFNPTICFVELPFSPNGYLTDHGYNLRLNVSEGSDWDMPPEDPFGNARPYGLYNSPFSSHTFSDYTWNTYSSTSGIGDPVSLVNQTFGTNPNWFYFDWNTAPLSAYVAITPSLDYDHKQDFNSLESGGSNGGIVTLNISKFTHVSNLCWVQTNKTEAINITSPAFADKNLVVDDRIYISYTSTGSNLKIYLINNGIVQQSYNLSSIIDITGVCTFDQINITGDFDDKENLQITSLYVKPANIMEKLVQTTSYVKMQTNTTETLTLRSPATISISLEEGYKITLGYSANATKEVKMNLKLSGVTKQSYTVIAEGGTGQTEFSVTEDDNIDQFEFTGIFSSTYFQINEILIESAIYTSPIYYFVLSAYESRLVPVPLGNYALTVTPYPATGETLLTQNETVAGYTLNTIDYSPYTGNERQVNIYNQQNKLLSFESFRVVVNRTINGITSPVNVNAPHYLMTNRFYADDKSYYNCTVDDRFGQNLYSITSAAITTFIDISLTVYKLKVYNQAEKFCYVNITKDPNHYGSLYEGIYWTEWIAPGEVIGYDLFAGYYVVHVTNYENSSMQNYAYTLNADDALLIGSENTVAQAIWNIQNTNVTLGNQISNVEINITNQNSNINNSIVMVDINLSNVNSTLGNSLLSIDSSIQSVNNTIGVNFVATNTSIYEIGSWVNTSYNLLSAQTYLINDSIYTTTAILDAGITSVNNTCNASFTTLIVKSDYLTYIFQHSVFSDLIDYSTDYNLTDDLYWTTFINQARNETYDLYLQYDKNVTTLRVNALTTLEYYLPKNASYRIWSVSKQAYLTEWTPISDNATGDYVTLDFGFFQDVVPVDLSDVKQTWVVWIFFGFAAIVVATMMSLYIMRMRSTLSQEERDDRRKRRQTTGIVADTKVR